MDVLSYALSKKFTEDTVIGLGYLKGAPCTIKSTTETDEGTIIVFEWTGTSGATQTTSILVKNGEDGQAQSITTTRTADDDGVVITIVNPDGTTASTATIYDGSSGQATSIDWSKIENKPFVSLNADDFEVDENGVLSVVATGKGNKIESISVNGTQLPITDKNVDITVPTVSTETDNMIETKTDGIYVKDMSAKISAETDNALVEKQDGLYVPSVSETKISAETGNQIIQKNDGVYVAPTDLTNYVEKVDGKGLSTNDLTDELKEQYDKAEENVQSDWNETDETSDAFIKNKPTIPDAYDDTALSNRVKTIEDDYAKSSDIPSLNNYLKTEDVSAVATSGSYNDLNNKPEFETVNIDFTTEY